MKILYYGFAERELEINWERMEHAINLPTFCRKLPDYEFSKLEKTRNFLVEKMRDRKRRYERNRVLKPKEETKVDLNKTESSESNSSRKISSNTSQKSDNQEIVLVDSNSGKVHC